MPRKGKHRRVFFKVRRCETGWWQPLVLLGEQPIGYGSVESKAEARRIARKRAAEFVEAGY
jgi:hypothetical protein